MASSPWLFGFAKNGTRYWLPHVLMGTADVLAMVATRTRYERAVLGVTAATERINEMCPGEIRGTDERAW